MVSEIKVVELARITGLSVQSVSMFLKDKVDDSLLTRIKNRVVGVSPEAAQMLLRQYIPFTSLSSVFLVANLCGGVGKTTSAINVCFGLRRIIDRKTAVVLVDGDAQGSATHQLCGEMATAEDKILVNYLEGNASLHEILTSIGDNMWVIRSNLNNASIEKLMLKPIDIKTRMLNLYTDIFKLLGAETKIVQDHHPDLSAFFASSICALYQLPQNIAKAVLVPLRSDAFAICGGQKIVQEIYELAETFSFNIKIPIHCYFSNMDRRIPTSGAALQIAATKEEIMKHLSSIVIRYSDQVPRSLHSHSHIYASGKKSKIMEDFNDLLISLFNK
jgi:cellulose biosynthesis protein BcsQ